MALKFLNKKGWHTGSLRNIENVWKAEQKRDVEQKKLEELRKQIHEERERHEFRLLQEQAGLVPKQERLDFLYESGLAVGKSSNSDGFKALEALPGTSTASASDAAKKEAAVPGALFEDKPHSSNDAWRKLHSDPLLMIRQREQEALARIKNNPIQMSMIKKSVKQNKDAKDHSKKERKRKHHHSKRKHQKHSSLEEELDSKDFNDDQTHRRKAAPDKSLKYAESSHFDDKPKKRERSKETDCHKHFKYSDDMKNDQYEKGSLRSEAHSSVKRNRDKSDWEGHRYEDRTNLDIKTDRENKSTSEMRSYEGAASSLSRESHHKRHSVKLSEEERAARLREMQLDAEVHEEQRWKRLKKADEDDAHEHMRSSMHGGKNFMDAAQKTIYGAGKGASSTIEESIRRRVYYSQGKSDSSERNAFRR